MISWAQDVRVSDDRVLLLVNLDYVTSLGKWGGYHIEGGVRPTSVSKRAIKPLLKTRVSFLQPLKIVAHLFVHRLR